MFQTRAPPGRWKPAGLFSKSLLAATGGHVLPPTEPFGPSFIFASSPWTQPASTCNFPEASTLQETKSAHLHHPASAFPLNPSPPHHAPQHVKSWNQQARGRARFPPPPMMESSSSQVGICSTKTSPLHIWSLLCHHLLPILKTTCAPSI